MDPSGLSRRCQTAADLAGFELVSLAGYVPRFVRGPALGSWGELPPTVTITFSGAVLSSCGEPLPARGWPCSSTMPGGGAADDLPFAAKLGVVTQVRPAPCLGALRGWWPRAVR